MVWCWFRVYSAWTGPGSLFWNTFSSRKISRSDSSDAIHLIDHVQGCIQSLFFIMIPITARVWPFTGKSQMDGQCSHVGSHTSPFQPSGFSINSLGYATNTVSRNCYYLFSGTSEGGKIQDDWTDGTAIETHRTSQQFHALQSCVCAWRPLVRSRYLVLWYIRVIAGEQAYNMIGEESYIIHVWVLAPQLHICALPYFRVHLLASCTYLHTSKLTWPIALILSPCLFTIAHPNILLWIWDRWLILCHLFCTFVRTSTRRAYQKDSDKLPRIISHVLQKALGPFWFVCTR